MSPSQVVECVSGGSELAPWAEEGVARVPHKPLFSFPPVAQFCGVICTALQQLHRSTLSSLSHSLTTGDSVTPTCINSTSLLRLWWCESTARAQRAMRLQVLQMMNTIDRQRSDFALRCAAFTFNALWDTLLTHCIRWNSRIPGSILDSWVRNFK